MNTLELLKSTLNLGQELDLQSMNRIRGGADDGDDDGGGDIIIPIPKPNPNTGTNSN